MSKAVNLYQILSRNTTNLSSGMVGLANVGKSTFFQAITKSTLGNPANYPFATIEPEESKVVIESDKLKTLQKIYNSSKMVPTSLRIYDIAGLTRNASTGAGLGNKFLNDIRQVDGVFQMVRGFRDDEIVHIENNVDPVRDLVIVTDELVLKDIEITDLGLEKLARQHKKPGQSQDLVKKETQLLEQLQEHLYEGKKLSAFEFKDIESVEMIKKYNFLSIKPTVYLLNVNEEDYRRDDNEFKQEVQQWLEENCPNDKFKLVCAKYESDIVDNRPEGETNRLKEIVQEMRDSLNLISYFTCGPKEAREWTIKRGTNAMDAAGLIHNDLRNSFIMAQVYKYEDIVEYKDEAELKKRGLQYRYGKKNEVEDGDVILFKSGKGN